MLAEQNLTVVSVAVVARIEGCKRRKQQTGFKPLHKYTNIGILSAELFQWAVKEKLGYLSDEVLCS